jgi:RNA polymerase sigma-70 factor (ECF subfamily)
MGETSIVEPSDLVLVDAVRQRRSDHAFRLLYRRHTPRALQVTWRILGGVEQDAEDAVQETWIRAVGSLGAWRADAPFGAWLNGIAAHVALDMVRRERRLPLAGDDVLASADPIHERLDLETAMRALAPGYRAVLVLHDVEGFSHEEIAQALGISPGTSRGQLFKARRAVRELLSHDDTPRRLRDAIR